MLRRGGTNAAARGRAPATALLLLAHALSTSSGSDLDCVSYTNMVRGDLPGMPTVSDNSSACRQLCESSPACALYTYVHTESPNADKCAAQRTHPNQGCCWLKAQEVGGQAPVVWDHFTCSGFVRVPADNSTSTTTAARAADNASSAARSPPPSPKSASARTSTPRNVLYLVITFVCHPRCRHRWATA
jgi:hypothetical protein